MHTRNYLNLATIILIVIYINLLLSVPDYPDKPDKALQKGKNRSKKFVAVVAMQFCRSRKCVRIRKSRPEHRRILRDITKYGQVLSVKDISSHVNRRESY